MRIALFGSNGQVGSALLASMPKAWTVIPLGRKDADLLVPGSAATGIRSIRPDVVINAAAWTDVDGAESQVASAYRVNRDAVREMASAGAPWLISYSTDYVFDGQKADAYTEEDAPAPLNVYGASKLAGEVELAKDSGRSVVFRTSWVHTPRHKNFATTILRLAAAREFLDVIDDQVGAPTSASLVAEVTVRTLEHIAQGKAFAPGIYHLAASGSSSWYDYAKFILRCAEGEGMILPCRIRPVSARQYGQAARRPANSRLDTTKLETALNFTFPAWQEGARKTVLDTLRFAATDRVLLAEGQD